MRAASRMRAAGRLAGIAALALTLLWLGGFAWFVHRIDRPNAPLPHADGIVVLTGAPGRVEAALHLLAQGQADRLLISGVGPGTGFLDIARRAGVAPDPAAGLAGRTTLGRAAHSTRGNAVEAAEWAHQFGIRTVIVVTSAYHMPRALAELSASLPDTVFAPYAVAADGTGWRLLAGEFNKYLAVVSGLRGLVAPGWPERDEKEVG